MLRRQNTMNNVSGARRADKGSEQQNTKHAYSLEIKPNNLPNT